MKKLPITVTLISKNEESRIADALNSVLKFATEVIVVDSGSTDQTVKIAQTLGATVHSRPFQGFGQQKNIAHELATQPWVLNIDADERVSEKLWEEIQNAIQTEAVDGFFIPRKTWYGDRWILHSGWYPNYLLRLAKRNKSSWTTPSLHEELKVQGKTDFLRTPLEHFSFKNVRSHVEKNLDYAERARFQEGGPKGNPCLLIWLIKPTWKFLHMFIVKRGFLDGRAGWVIAVNSAYSMFLKYAYQWEAECSIEGGKTIENSNYRQ